jgi:hypothetical protein
MALPHSARSLRTREGAAGRLLCVVACGAFALGGALASCATGVDDSGGSGDSGLSAHVTQAGEDGAAEAGGGGDDATIPGEDAGDPDGGVNAPLDSSSTEEPDSSSEMPDTWAPPPLDASTRDSAADAAPIVDASPVDAALPHDAGGGGIDASGSQDAGNCGGLPVWFAGTMAQEVQNGGERYTCKVPGWCDQTGVSAVDAWEPGVGTDWQDAWTDSGPCS